MAYAFEFREDMGSFRSNFLSSSGNAQDCVKISSKQTVFPYNLIQSSPSTVLTH